MDYYLNKIIIKQNLEAKGRQRVIYIFKNIKDIEIRSKENDHKENIHKLEKGESFLIGVDGVILEKEDKSINFERKICIVEQVNKFSYVENSEKIISYHETETISNEEKNNIESDVEDDANNLFEINKNCLCVIEIKNQFLAYSNDEIKKI